MAAQTKSITLDPGQSGSIGFTITPNTVKTYQVNVNGLTGSFVAISLPPEFEVSNLIISPTQVYVGEPVTISVTVTNVGGTRGTAIITLEVT